MFINYRVAFNHAGKCLVRQPGVSIEREATNPPRRGLALNHTGGRGAGHRRTGGIARMGDTAPRGIILVPVILGSPNPPLGPLVVA